MVEFEETKKARLILSSTTESVRSFFVLFEKFSRQGAPSNEQIDLLRAALTFAASGLDSTLKQLIKDCLPKLIENEKVEKLFISYITKELKGDIELDDKNNGRKFLAKILISSKSPKEELIERYIEDMAKGSLQNTKELDRCRAALGISSLDNKERNLLNGIFQKRNKIIHELDANLNISKKGKRHRNRHSKKDIEKDCSKLTKEYENIIKEVEKEFKLFA